MNEKQPNQFKIKLDGKTTIVITKEGALSLKERKFLPKMNTEEFW